MAELNDRIYGAVHIEEPVLLELFASAALDRLKRIAQYGVPEELYYLQGFSRYEHSVGVMMLLRRFGASLEEQVAGLLHDASHTAFSHVIDWVIGDQVAEDFQDNHMRDVICAGEVKGILERHGFDPELIADHDQFSLLEQKTPDICADRLDYALREFSPDVARVCLSGLSVCDGRFVFVDRGSARCFAENFLRRQQEHWGGFEAVNRYRLFAAALKIAMEKGVVEMNDFWIDDEAVMQKISAAHLSDVEEIFSELRNVPLNPKHLSNVKKKFRHVNPQLIENDRLVRLCDVDEEFSSMLETARRENENGV